LSREPEGEGLEGDNYRVRALSRHHGAAWTTDHQSGIWPSVQENSGIDGGYAVFGTAEYTWFS
jgi:hypothetical protein